MKRLTKLIVLFLSLVMVVSVVACGDTSTSTGSSSTTPSSSSSSSSEEVDKPSTVNGVQLATTKYAPAADIPQLSGTINYINYVGAYTAGWENVINLYKKYQPNVKIETTFSADTTTNDMAVQTALTTGGVDIYSQAKGVTEADVAVNLYSHVNDFNPYSNSIWKDVLTTSAYTKDSGEAGKLYSLNTNTLTTGFGYNKDILDEVGVDYSNIANWTWEEFISCLTKLKAAGYTHPLAMGASYKAFNADHGNWSLRIYGDYLTRDLLPEIQRQSGDYDYDGVIGSLIGEGGYKDLAAMVIDPYVEKSASYQASETRIFSAIYNTSDPLYAKLHARFEEFWSQYSQIMEFVSTDYLALQRNNTAALMIKEDKADKAVFWNSISGTLVELLTKYNLNVGFCNYFRMSVDGKYYSRDERAMRSVNGGGGTLCVVNSADANKQAIALDFYKFFMSPIGQQAYYDGLNDANVVPDGPTTLKNNLVIYPAAWDFSALPYNGLATSNPLTAIFTGVGTITAKDKSSYTNSAEKMQVLYADWYNGFAKDGKYSTISAGQKTFIDGYYAYLTEALGNLETVGSVIYARNYKNDFYMHPGVNPSAV